MSAIEKTAQFSDDSPLALSPRKKSACLVKIHPANGGDSIFDLKNDSVVMGRDVASRIALVDPRVSRRHAIIELIAGDYVLRDLGSTNGTYVNDQRVDQQKLTAGDLVRLGDHVFKFLADGHIELLYHQETAKIVARDDLTSAYTKRYFLDRLDEEIARWIRTDRPLSLLMLDIDFFKKVNDTHGHPVGDEVLREFSRRVRSVIHRDDLFARYGGEEFAILLPCTNIREAGRIAERCRQVTVGEPFVTSSGQIDVTASVGVATASNEVHDRDLLIAAADERLYEAKRSGRNRVAC
ncbi:MAG: GGDEF domain-containing protein [Pirellulales bacterium]|nr:GGDEF domain-containing protein [Pirellulales bacterium]